MIKMVGLSLVELLLGVSFFGIQCLIQHVCFFSSSNFSYLLWNFIVCSILFHMKCYHFGGKIIHTALRFILTTILVFPTFLEVITLFGFLSLFFEIVFLFGSCSSLFVSSY